MDDIFSMFGDVFGGHGGSGGGFEALADSVAEWPTPAIPRFGPARLKVRLTLEEIATGVTKSSK